MLRKVAFLVVWAMLWAPLMADVELTTSINDVFNRGSNELAGSITMRVNANDFNTASTLEPVFIRITLDHNATLSQTLVNLNSVNGLINKPIYLAMRLNDPGPIFGLQADRQTVSIVRWVAGESSFWVRVQSDSSTWISTLGGSPRPPEEELTVSWTLGISARLSFNTMATVLPVGGQVKRNLPFNTRDVTTAGLAEDAVSTLICCDLTRSDLTTTGVESLLNFDPIAFDQTAQISLGNYRPGNDTGINFTNDFAIARGKRRECTVEVVGKGARVVANLCIPRTGLNQDEQGFIWITNDIWFEIDCNRGADLLTTDLFNGAYITFRTTGGSYGFEDNSVRFLDGGVGFDIPVANRAFNSHGRTLYRTTDLIWNGGFRTLDGYRVHVEVDVHYYYLDGPVDVVLDWAITLVNHDGELDAFPFDGPDQHRRCPRSQFQIANGTWDYGAFVECSGMPTALFFPYVPRIKGSTDSWAGLSVVNHGAVDFPNLDVIIYADNGDRFTAVFPALPVRNQDTWLLIEDAGGAGFYEMGTNNPPIIPQPSNPAVPPESFGEGRMSMFIVGNFEAVFREDIFSGDLDGYMLIGKGGDIDGSYLPRNYDNDIPNQNADLPIRRSKALNPAPKRSVTNQIGDHVPARFQFDSVGRLTNKNQ